MIPKAGSQMMPRSGPGRRRPRPRCSEALLWSKAARGLALSVWEAAGGWAVVLRHEALLSAHASRTWTFLTLEVGPGSFRVVVGPRLVRARRPLAKPTVWRWWASSPSPLIPSPTPPRLIAALGFWGGTCSKCGRALPVALGKVLGARSQSRAPCRTHSAVCT